MNEILGFFEKTEQGILVQIENLEKVLVHLRYEGKVHRGKNIKNAKQTMEALSKTLKKHRNFQEEIIFPYLLVHIPKHESVIQFLRLDHQTIRKSKVRLYRLLERLSEQKPDGLESKILGLGIYLIYLVRHHIELERSSIHKAVKHELKLDEQMDVAKKAKDWLNRYVDSETLTV